MSNTIRIGLVRAPTYADDVNGVVKYFKIKRTRGFIRSVREKIGRGKVKIVKIKEPS